MYLLGTLATQNANQGFRVTYVVHKVSLKRLRISLSMDSKYHWAGYIMIERWVHCLKAEEIGIHKYDAPRILRQAIGIT